MCLVLFAYRFDARQPLVIAANRDEFFARPTATMNFWPEAPDLLGGRDLVHGGMWFGVTRQARIALVTNVRQRHAPGGPRSRGALVRDFLQGSVSAADFLADLVPRATEYPGFNLLLGTPSELFYYSNAGGDPRPLRPGLYGLSNARLDSPWPKVEEGKRRLQQALNIQAGDWDEHLFALLADRRPAPDAELPETGYGLDWERLLSPAFIHSPTYGTRSSTVLRLDGAGVATVMERTFDDRGDFAREARFLLDWHEWLPDSDSNGSREDSGPANS